MLKKLGEFLVCKRIKSFLSKGDLLESIDGNCFNLKYKMKPITIYYDKKEKCYKSMHYINVGTFDYRKICKTMFSPIEFEFIDYLKNDRNREAVLSKIKVDNKIPRQEER